MQNFHAYRSWKMVILSKHCQYFIANNNNIYHAMDIMADLL